MLTTSTPAAPSETYRITIPTDRCQDAPAPRAASRPSARSPLLDSTGSVASVASQRSTAHGEMGQALLSRPWSTVLTSGVRVSLRPLPTLPTQRKTLVLRPPAKRRRKRHRIRCPRRKGREGVHMLHLATLRMAVAVLGRGALPLCSGLRPSLLLSFCCPAGISVDSADHARLRTVKRQWNLSVVLVYCDATCSRQYWIGATWTEPWPVVSDRLCTGLRPDLELSAALTLPGT